MSSRPWSALTRSTIRPMASGSRTFVSMVITRAPSARRLAAALSRCSGFLLARATVAPALARDPAIPRPMPVPPPVTTATLPARRSGRKTLPGKESLEPLTDLGSPQGLGLRGPLHRQDLLPGAELASTPETLDRPVAGGGPTEQPLDHCLDGSIDRGIIPHLVSQPDGEGACRIDCLSRQQQAKGGTR